MPKILLGVAISLSGRYAIQGKESFAGLCLWVRDVNAAGGIWIADKKFAVELIHYDDESSVDTCRKFVDKLINQDKVDILIGPYGSGHTLAAVPIAEAHRKMLWNHGGSSDEIFEQGFRYLVSAITPASAYLAGIIELVRKRDPAANTIALIRAEQSGFATNIAAGVKRHGKERGFQVIELTYPSGNTDFSPLLSQVRQHNPAIILGAGRTDDDVGLARQLVANQVQARAIGIIAAGIKEFGDLLGKDAEGFFGPSQWEQSIKLEPDVGVSPQEFARRFKNAYAKEPDYPAAQGYNIGLVIQRCIEAAGSLDDLSLREVAKRAAFKTFYGTFKIDPLTGNQIGHIMTIVQWQGSKRYIVYPEGMAEKAPNLF